MEKEGFLRGVARWLISRDEQCFRNSIPRRRGRWIGSGEMAVGIGNERPDGYVIGSAARMPVGCERGRETNVCDGERRGKRSVIS